MTKDDLDRILALLHSEVAKSLLKRIRADDVKPGDFMAAIRFLKDNGFDAVPNEGDDVSKLAELVPFPSTKDDDASGYDYPH